MIQHEEKKHRRAVIKQGIIVAGVGAVATLQATAGTAHANGTETATIFSDIVDPVVTVRNTSTNGSNVTIGGSPHGIISTAGNHGVGVIGQGGTDTNGVSGISTSASGVAGISTSGVGTTGICTSGDGVNGRSDSGNGVVGISGSRTGVLGQSTSGDAIIALARPLASTDHPTALHVQGTIKVEVDGNGRDNPVGTATLALAASSVTVNNPVTTPDSIVILTPKSDPGATVWVTTTTGSFTIHRAMSFFPVHPAVTFNYLIIN